MTWKHSCFITMGEALRIGDKMIGAINTIYRRDLEVLLRGGRE